MAKKKIENMSVAELDDVDEDALFNESDDTPVEEPVAEPEPESELPVEEPAPVVEVKVEPQPVAEESPAAMAFQIREMKRREAELLDRIAKQAQPEQPKPQPVDQDPEPDQTTDPIGHIMWTNRKLQARIDAQEKWRNETTQQTEAQMADQRRAYELKQAEDAFEKTQPDYTAAAESLWNKITRNARDFAPTATPEQIQKFCLQRIFERGESAKALGKSPAQAIYEWSKEMGYAPAQAEPARQTPNLEIIDKNRRRSANGLGTGSGGKTSLTAQSVAGMSTADILALPDDELQSLGLN